MRQISHWRCEAHPANEKKIISAGRHPAPVCDWQTELTASWPCRRTMVLFAPEVKKPVAG
jgi:hypothetical protein